MREAFRHVVDRPFDFPGIADEDGNVYWFERMSRGLGGPIDLVSIASDGAVRFRQPIVDALDWVWEAALGDGVIYVGAHAGASAYDSADGHLLWTRSVADEVGHPAERYYVDGIAVAADETPIFSFVSMGNALESEAHSFVIALDAATGATRWKRQVRGKNLAADGAGNVFFEAGTGGLYSLDTEGQVRWIDRTLRGASADLAVANGVLIGDSVVRTTDGADLGAFRNDLRSQFALLGPAGGFIAYAGYLAPIATPPPTLGTPIPVPQAVMYHPYATSLLSGGRVLVANGTSVAVYAGANATSCELQGFPLYAGTTSAPIVQPGRFVTALSVQDASGAMHPAVVAFDAAGFAPAAHGWITQRGSYARNGRAR